MTGEVPVEEHRQCKQQKNEQVIRRRKPDSNGLYIKGSIEGMNLTFTADTEATRRIFWDRFYNKLQPDKLPQLKNIQCTNKTRTCNDLGVYLWLLIMQIKKAIQDLLDKGVIRKSTSPWDSPIVFVKKKNGSIRPCVDSRKVNELVKPDGFPIPRIQDCLDAVANATLFSTFDLTSRCFQIPLKDEDIPSSAFFCNYGQFEMLRLPFGLNSREQWSLQYKAGDGKHV